MGQWKVEFDNPHNKGRHSTVVVRGPAAPLSFAKHLADYFEASVTVTPDDGREFMALVLPFGNILYVFGENASSNQIDVSKSGGNFVTVINGQTTTTPVGNITVVAVFGGDQPDNINVRLSDEDVTVYSRGGDDVMDLALGNGTLIFNGGNSQVTLRNNPGPTVSRSMYVVTCQAGSVTGTVQNPAVVQPRPWPGASVNITPV